MLYMLLCYFIHKRNERLLIVGAHLNLLTKSMYEYLKSKNWYKKKKSLKTLETIIKGLKEIGESAVPAWVF